ncbi:MAG: tRNA (adenosine(37)-N6)-dimethylallyltransferase MiaA [Magnetococcales bacterium]|nr:tRNA (adenosine(37)-N6)-dimethylallyltransferase MiaA [Magnetococcales bacterium]
MDLKNHHNQPPVIFLMGPTASGKSRLAMELASRLPCEIVNADSVQIYRGMTIGAAKPSTAERQQIPHHLLDVTDPQEPWSADRYREAAWNLIPHLHARDVIPLFVGGSGLYLRAVEQGLAETPPIDPTILDQIRTEANQTGWPELHRMLAQVDPESAQRITVNDSQRILRALSVWRATTIPLSRWQREQPPPPPWRILKLALLPPRAELYPRIEARFDQMLTLGVLDEARALLNQGCARALPAMKAVGYRQLFAYLDGHCSLTEAVALAKQESRRYAKRQETWLKRETGLIRLTQEPLLDEALAHIARFLNVAA